MEELSNRLCCPSRRGSLLVRKRRSCITPPHSSLVQSTRDYFSSSFIAFTVLLLLFDSFFPSPPGTIMDLGCLFSLFFDSFLPWRCAKYIVHHWASVLNISSRITWIGLIGLFLSIYSPWNPIPFPFMTIPFVFDRSLHPSSLPTVSIS